MYDMLPDSDRVKFRQAWSVQCSFQSIKESRVKRQTDSTYFGKKDFFLTPLAIAGKLGGSQFALCRSQAAAYCKAAVANGGPKFCQFNGWQGAWTFLYLEKLVASGTKTEWEMISETYDMINPWEELATVCLVVRACGGCHNPCVLDVSNYGGHSACFTGRPQHVCT